MHLSKANSQGQAEAVLAPDPELSVLPSLPAGNNCILTEQEFTLPDFRPIPSPGLSACLCFIDQN